MERRGNESCLDLLVYTQRYVGAVRREQKGYSLKMLSMISRQPDLPDAQISCKPCSVLDPQDGEADAQGVLIKSRTGGAPVF